MLSAHCNKFNTKQAKWLTVLFLSVNMQISPIDQDKHDKQNLHYWLEAKIFVLGMCTLVHMVGQSNAVPSGVGLIQ